MKVLFRLAGFTVGFALLLCAAGVSAQQLAKRIDAAEMFGEYGRIGGCDHSARLDILAIRLQSNPKLESYIIYYGPESAGRLTFDIIKNYLVNSRGLAEDRFKTVYAGPNNDPKQPRVQLWLAPHGAPLPELPRYKNEAEKFNGLFDEHEGWDETYAGWEEGDTGPPMPDVTFPTFVDLLKRRQDTVAYIVAFSGTAMAPGGWRRVAQRESERMRNGGVSSDRVRIIYGGSDKATEQVKVQLWILPQSAPAPVADAGPEPPPNSTLKIGTFGEYPLGEEKGERGAFNIVLAALQTSPELRVCIIVRVEPEEAELEAAPEETPVTQVTTEPGESPRPQPANLLKLIEKWKTELAGKHKVRGDRLVLLFAAPEFPGNSLEAWVVPRGALLPDPNAKPPEEGGGEYNPS